MYKYVETLYLLQKKWLKRETTATIREKKIQWIAFNQLSDVCLFWKNGLILLVHGNDMQYKRHHEVCHEIIE